MEIGRKFKAPTKEMLKYYQDLYLRNQNKWVRKSMLKPEDMGKKFTHEDLEFELVGAVSPKEFLIKDENGEHYVVLTQFVDSYLLPSQS
jgi:hypothetical protein